MWVMAVCFAAVAGVVGYQLLSSDEPSPVAQGDVVEIRQSRSPVDPGSSISDRYMHLEAVDTDEARIEIEGHNQ